MPLQKNSFSCDIESSGGTGDTFKGDQDGNVRKVSDSGYKVWIGGYKFMGNILAIFTAADIWLAYIIDYWVQYTVATFSNKDGSSPAAAGEHSKVSIDPAPEKDAESIREPEESKESKIGASKKKTAYKTEELQVFLHEYATKATDKEKEIERNWSIESNSIDKLPAYYKLCFMQQREMQKSLTKYIGLLSLPFSAILCIAGVGNFLTKVGILHWLVVARKYFIFFSVCVGVWTDEAVNSYQLEHLMDTFSNKDHDEIVMRFIPLIVGSRALLLQALGPGATLLSVMIIIMCPSPLFCTASKLHGVTPGLFVWNSREIAIRRERIEQAGYLSLRESSLDVERSASEEIDNWIINFRSMSIFLIESRIITFTVSSVTLFMVLSVLFNLQPSPAGMLFVFSLLIPYFLGFSLVPMIAAGKTIQLTDKDFNKLRLTCFTGVPKGATNKVGGAEFEEKDEEKVVDAGEGEGEGSWKFSSSNSSSSNSDWDLTESDWDMSQSNNSQTSDSMQLSKDSILLHDFIFSGSFAKNESSASDSEGSLSLLFAENEVDSKEGEKLEVRVLIDGVFDEGNTYNSNSSINTSSSSGSSENSLKRLFEEINQFADDKKAEDIADLSIGNKTDFSESNRSSKYDERSYASYASYESHESSKSSMDKESWSNKSNNDDIDRDSSKYDNRNLDNYSNDLEGERDDESLMSKDNLKDEDYLSSESELLR